MPSSSESTTPSQRLVLRAFERSDRAQGMDARAKEGLVGVDVPHAGNPLLVEQEGLDRLLSPARHRAQGVGGEVGVERLDAQPGSEVLGEGAGSEQDIARAETAHVDEEQAPAVVEVQAHPEVVGLFGVRVVEQEIARHAQVHDEMDVVLEREHQVFAAPPDALDLAAPESIGDRLGRRRHRPARVPDVDRLEAPALERGRQLTADRLDLGKLGHRPKGSSARPRAGGP